MISKQAFELVQRLQQLKNSDEAHDSKKTKYFSHSMSEFEAKAMRSIGDLNQKVANIQEQLNSIRNFEKGQEQIHSKRANEFQNSLRRLIESYQSEADQANRKLQSLLETVKEQLKSNYKQSIKIQRTTIQGLKAISSKANLLLEQIRRQQKASIDSYQLLKRRISEEAEATVNLQHQKFAEFTKGCQKLQIKTNQSQQKAEQNFIKISGIQEKKLKDANKGINILIQQNTISDKFIQ